MSNRVVVYEWDGQSLDQIAFYRGRNYVRDMKILSSHEGDAFILVMDACEGLDLLRWRDSDNSLHHIGSDHSQRNILACEFVVTPQRIEEELDGGGQESSSTKTDTSSSDLKMLPSIQHFSQNQRFKQTLTILTADKTGNIVILQYIPQSINKNHVLGGELLPVSFKFVVFFHLSTPNLLYFLVFFYFLEQFQAFSCHIKLVHRFQE